MQPPTNLGRRILVFPDKKHASGFVARHVADLVKTYPNAVLGLATGSTMISIYQFFVFLQLIEHFSVRDVTTVNMDEHLNADHTPVDPDHPLSYVGFMRTHLHGQLPFDPAKLHFPVPDPSRPDDPFHAFVAAILARGMIDLQLGGIGEEGHIAFNEANDSTPDSPTRIVRLSPGTIRVNSRFVDDDITRVPPLAATIGMYELLNLTKQFVLVAFGEKKAQAIRDAIDGPAGSHCPASFLRWPYHRNTLFVLDEAAAHLLTAGTVERRLY